MVGHHPSIYFVNKDIGYIAGASGTILRTVNGGGIVTGIKQFQQINNDVILFPNPVKTTLFVTITNPNATVFLYDLQGNLLMNKQIAYRDQINVNSLHEGIYVLKILDGSKVIIDRFVKE